MLLYLTGYSCIQLKSQIATAKCDQAEHLHKIQLSLCFFKASPEVKLNERTPKQLQTDTFSLIHPASISIKANSDKFPRAARVSLERTGGGGQK